MTTADIRTRIKQIVFNVTNIPIEKIRNHDSFQDDLDLDSLSLLEISVDLDYEFKLGLPEERLQEIRTVAEAVALVEKCLSENEPARVA